MGFSRLIPAAALTVAVASGLSACSESADPNALYPLAPGLQWTYRMELKPFGETQTNSTRTMENVRLENFAGEPGVAIRRNESGERFYVVQRDDGYYRVARKSVTTHYPIMDQPAVRILPLPADKGATWVEPAHTFMLGRAKTFITENAPGNTITLDYHIESTDAEVDVPAGHFTGCVEVIGRTSFHLGSGVGFLPSDVPIVQREWYCPRHGLVRLERDEKVTNVARVITGGHMSFTLLSGPE